MIRNLFNFILFCFYFNAYANENITIARSEIDYIPNEYHENGKLTGFHIELINTVCKNLDWNCNFENYPWGRAQEQVKKGKCDAISYISINDERESYAYFDKNSILSETTYAFFITKNKLEKFRFSGDIPKLAKKYNSLGLIKNYHYKDEIIKAPFQFEWSANEEASAIKLVNGRMNLFFGEVTSFHQNLKRLGYSKDIIQLKPEIYKIPVYLAFAKKLDFSKADQEKALLKSQAFAKGMQMFKRTEQYQILLNKYSNIFAN